MSDTQKEYRVLARKYRPRNFDDLVGQDALVRTLKNAIESGRIAHAFMLTGIRGVGKTTTARIIAKALNYKGPDGTAGPTTGSTDDCDLCKAITEDRHPDVMEMDAASRTGVDDIREILEGVRYAPVSARYKIYIIDEVHMLSKSAFNALLKTLEEPPPHVKFIFATTEIRRVPVTVLSRCQRFDLRRVDADVLKKYYGKICEREGVEAQEEALALIARAADGSVRDGLSLLDQAIAFGEGLVSVSQVKDMLGFADRSRILDLLSSAIQGQTSQALDILEDLHMKGADPAVIISDLLDLCHLLTRLRAVPDSRTSFSGMAKEETERAMTLARALSMPALSRTWQILLKGVSEVNQAPVPQAAAEMILIRLAYTAELPDPVELIRKLKDGDNKQGRERNDSSGSSFSSVEIHGAMESSRSSVMLSETSSFPGAPIASVVARQAIAVASSSVGEERAVRTLEDVVRVLERNGSVALASQVYLYVHLVQLEEGRLEFRPAQESPVQLAQALSQGLKAATGQRWMVSISDTIGAPTLAEKKAAEEKAVLDSAREDLLVRQILEIFPEAQLESVYEKEGSR